MNVNASLSPQRSRHFQIITQVGWLILVGTMLVPFVIGIPVRFNHIMQLAGPQDVPVINGLPPVLEKTFFSRLGLEEVEALKMLGISQSVYAGYILFFDIALVLVCTGIGLLIFWQKSDDWMVISISILVIFTGANGVSLVAPTLSLIWPDWLLMYLLIGYVGMASTLHIFFLSPDGRFVPKWTQRIAAGFTGMVTGVSLFVAFLTLKSDLLQVLDIIQVGLFFAVLFPWLVLLGIGIGSQVYRYRRVSGLVQRQQTKWVAIGLAAVVLGVMFNSGIFFISSQGIGVEQVVWNLIRAPVVNLFLSLFPITLAFSIFRYKLWDIDILIRRTLQYGVLTGLLALIYYGLVITLQSLFASISNQQSPIFIVISTLAIAALFNPLRHRIQDFIDRRFYRKKYDAEQALARFTATTRDEVDIEKLTEALLGVVEETIQPESVSLMLKMDRGNHEHTR